MILIFRDFRFFCIHSVAQLPLNWDLDLHLKFFSPEGYVSSYKIVIHCIQGCTTITRDGVIRKRKEKEKHILKLIRNNPVMKDASNKSRLTAA